MLIQLFKFQILCKKFRLESLSLLQFRKGSIKFDLYMYSLFHLACQFRLTQQVIEGHLFFQDRGKGLDFTINDKKFQISITLTLTFLLIITRHQFRDNYHGGPNGVFQFVTCIKFLYTDIYLIKLHNKKVLDLDSLTLFLNLFTLI